MTRFSDDRERAGGFCEGGVWTNDGNRENGLRNVCVCVCVCVCAKLRFRD